VQPDFYGFGPTHDRDGIPVRDPYYFPCERGGLGKYEDGKEEEDKNERGNLMTRPPHALMITE
jgi:hypothetical protein